MLYLGWIAAAFLGGFLFGCWYHGRQRETGLERRSAEIESFAALSYDEILRLLNALPQSARQEKNGVMKRTWREGGYAITLSFAPDGICLGVDNEQING